MKSIYKTILIALIFVVTGCENLEDLNKNPNQPEEVSANVLLTSAIRSSVNSMVTESFLLGNNISQLTAKTLRTEVDVYSWNAFPTVWEEMYSALANLDEVERIAVENENTYMEGTALVLKSWIYSILTLAYGDIPYSEAIKGDSDGEWFPEYDKQQDILTGEEGVLDELERAVELFDTGSGSIGGDILFEGKVMLWKKLANSLRLRILMHLSVKEDVAAEFAAIVNNQPIMESNNDNAVLKYTGTYPNEFPTVPLKQGDFDAVVMSESAVSVMQMNNDPRMAVIARPSNLDEVLANDSIAPEYDGAVNGLETGGCDKSGSRLGYIFYNYPGHPVSANKADGIIMTYAEVEFLLAEASQKGWIGSDSESHYQKAIKSSMDYYGVDYSAFGWTDFSDYYSNSGLQFDDGLTTIWQQKWLSLFFHGLEPYFEFRRWMIESNNDWAALPFVSPPCLNTNDNMLPLRFLYPGNEQSVNTENYNAAVERLGGSNSQNAEMWLLK